MIKIKTIQKKYINKFKKSEKLETNKKKLIFNENMMQCIRFLLKTHFLHFYLFIYGKK